MHTPENDWFRIWIVCKYNAKLSVYNCVIIKLNLISHCTSIVSLFDCELGIYNKYNMNVSTNSISIHEEAQLKSDNFTPITNTNTNNSSR